MTIDGKETVDPTEAFNGLILPVGGYKGYGLTVMVGILSAVLTGGSILSAEVKDFYEDVKERQNIGHLFGCIKIDKFLNTEAFKGTMDCMIQEIKGSKKAPGVEEILLPGEREFKAAALRMATGIPLQENILLDLEEIGKVHNLGRIEVK